MEMVIIGASHTWFTLENEKKTAVSQDWRHKKEKPSYQSFNLMVGYQKMYILGSKFELHYLFIFIYIFSFFFLHVTNLIAAYRCY